MAKEYKITQILKDLNWMRKNDMENGMVEGESSMCSKLFQSAVYEQMKKIEGPMRSEYSTQYIKAWKGRLEEVA